MAQRPNPLPQDGIYRAILTVMVGSVLVGAAVALIGRYVYQSEAMSEAGGWLAVVCGVLYFVFRWLGAREAKRQAQNRPTARGDAWNDFDERDE